MIDSALNCYSSTRGEASSHVKPNSTQVSSSFFHMINQYCIIDIRVMETDVRLNSFIDVITQKRVI